jgi:hypothetical protein
MSPDTSADQQQASRLPVACAPFAQDPSDDGLPAPPSNGMGAPRIAVYSDTHSPPEVTEVDDPLAEERWRQLAQSLAERAYHLARGQGGQIPLVVFSELMDNLVHAWFAGVVITILDRATPFASVTAVRGYPTRKRPSVRASRRQTPWRDAAFAGSGRVSRS